MAKVNNQHRKGMNKIKEYIYALLINWIYGRLD